MTCRSAQTGSWEPRSWYIRVNSIWDLIAIVAIFIIVPVVQSLRDPETRARLLRRPR